jgi:hypothetical protein
MVEEAGKTIEDTTEADARVAHNLITRLRSVNDTRDEARIEFGVRLSAHTGGVHRVRLGRGGLQDVYELAPSGSEGLGGWAAMDDQFAYQDFDLLVEPGSQGRYRARVLRSPAGESAPVQFRMPFSAVELENFVLKIGRSGRRTRGPGRPESAPLKDLGGKLYAAVFKDELRDTLLSSLSQTRAQGVGMRLRLRLTDAPELADLPWEFLYDRRLNRFLAQSRRTPLVRYLDLPDPPRPLRVDGPLRLLVMISSPSDWPTLDVEHEWSVLTDALARQQAEGRVIIERLAANMGALRRRLRREEFHVFHFIGHGQYRADWGDGVLVMDDRHGRPNEVTGEELGGLLNEHDPTRLAVLNACEGARSDASDPFAGMAQSLIQQGLPAVVAMQFEITDDAAIIFAQELYGAIGDGYPVEAALAEARGAIRDEGNPTEWGTPVLYSRAPDGHLFDLTHQSRMPQADRNVREEAHRKTQEEDTDRKGQAGSSKPKWRRSSRDDGIKVLMSRPSLDDRIDQLTSRSSREDDSAGGAPRSFRDDLAEVLEEEELILTQFLEIIDYDVRLLDANLEDAHRLVEDIRGLLKKYVPDTNQLSSSAGVRETYDRLDQARAIENDSYELYAHDLERYQERGKDLDEVVKRRRAYISELREFQLFVSTMVITLRGPSGLRPSAER